MKRSTEFLFLTALLWLNATALAAFPDDQPGKQPNIVFILADDLGYGSINDYGADKALLRTPHINRLAEQGMRFTQAYTPASVCTPTRYGLLTGRYPWRSSLKFGVVGRGDPLLPNPGKTTVADWLKESGYHTAAIGKWHLGYGKAKPVDFTGKLAPGPLDLGFDYHFGVPQNHGGVLGVYIENDGIYGLRSKKVHPYSKSFYGAQYAGFDAPQRVSKNVMKVLTNKAIDWLSTQKKDQPFFLYFTPVAVHHPITPSDYMRGLSDCGPYGDFIQDLDWSVGKIVEALNYMGMAENTLIIISSDNGGDIPIDPKSPERQAIQLGLDINGKLRGDKHTIWEGGTRVPFIASWPGKVPAGSISNDMINLVDVFATLAEITGHQLPETKDVAPDSFSFLPSLFQSKNRQPRGPMVTADVKGLHAIRVGDWKYIDDSLPNNLPKRRLKKVKRSLAPQLYNLADDPGEQTNVYAQYPEKAGQLLKKLNRIRQAGYTR